MVLSQRRRKQMLIDKTNAEKVSSNGSSSDAQRRASAIPRPSDNTGTVEANVLIGHDTTISH